jgi:hypothetical protein
MLEQPRQIGRRLLSAAIVLTIVAALVFILYRVNDGGGHPPAPTPDQPPVDESLIPPLGGRASTTPTRLTATCTLRVVDAADKPVPGAPVVAWTDETTDTPPLRTTDERGEVPFASTTRARGFVAWRDDGVLVVRQPLVDATPTITLVLGGEAAVAGTVLVDGAPAPVGTELTLTTDADPALATLPRAIAERVRSTRPRRTTTTDHRGAFVFDGLPEHWSGALLPPATHWLTEPFVRGQITNELPLPAPRRDLVLHLTSLAVATGRVVWDDDGTPIAKAPLQFVVAFGGDECTATGLAREDGTFAIGLAPAAPDRRARWADGTRRPAPTRIRVWCAGVPGSLETAHVEVVLPEHAEDHTLPPVEVRVRRAARTWFVAHDAVGAAITGVRVDTQDCEPSDETGRGSFTGSPTLVGAPDHQVAPAAASAGTGTLADPLRFVLAPQNRITFTLAATQEVTPEIAAAIELVLEGPPPLLEGGAGWSTLHTTFGGSSGNSGRRRIPGSGEQALFVHTLRLIPDRLDGNARAVVHSLTPGLPCRIVANDLLGRPLLQHEFVTPPRGQHERIAVTLSTPVHTLRGRAQHEGAAVPQAEVLLLAGEDRTRTRTAADGTFVFAAVAGEGPFDLVVLAPGFVKAERVGLSTANPTPHVLELTRGRTITVHVRDDRGEPVDLFAKPRGHDEHQPQRLGIGTFTWPDQPEVVEFVAELQGRTFTQWCQPGADEVVVTVPSLGTVVVPSAATARARGWLEAAAGTSRVTLVLQSLDDASRTPLQVRLRNDQEVEVPVLPGRYTAELAGRRSTIDVVSRARVRMDLD